ncbi:unnamed protein product [Rotaria magnacalcarata]
MMLTIIFISWKSAYLMWKNREILVGILPTIIGLVMCVTLIEWFVVSVYVRVQNYRQQRKQYQLREPIKYNSSSRYVKIKWLSKRHIQKLKMLMKGVFIHKNCRFNI